MLKQADSYFASPPPPSSKQTRGSNPWCQSHMQIEIFHFEFFICTYVHAELCWKNAVQYKNSLMNYSRAYRGSLFFSLYILFAILHDHLLLSFKKQCRTKIYKYMFFPVIKPENLSNSLISDLLQKKAHRKNTTILMILSLEFQKILGRLE